MPQPLQSLLDALNKIAPPASAEPWDNVGLLVGDPRQSVNGVMLTIDYTAAVAAEAVENHCDFVIAYHPPIFSPLKRITASSVIYDAIRAGVAIYSPHTALDVAKDGTNDVLADVIGLANRQPLRQATGAGKQFTLVTFIPAEAVEKVSEALFAAGAGRIGDYRSCSFRTPGTGTFFGEEGTNPAVGSAGQLETADEVRVETVVSICDVPQVITALRATHPYEEPAFDLVTLAARPTGQGMGRVGELSPPVGRPELFARIKRELAIEHLLIAGPTDGVVAKAAVCAGSCGDLLDDAIAAKVDLYLTGEMKHHDALKAAAAGVTVVCTLHSNSERVTLTRLQARMAHEFPSLPIQLSQQDRDPFSIR